MPPFSTRAGADNPAFQCATQAERGFVRLIYVTDEGEELSFTRAIQATGAKGDGEGGAESVYKVGRKTVSLTAYQEKLAELGILVKIRNFLVFQGACIGR